MKSNRAPESVIYDYREALRRLYGDGVADHTKIYYSNTWYYINLARLCPDGSYLIPDIATAKRKATMLVATARLIKEAQEKAKAAFKREDHTFLCTPEDCRCKERQK